MSYEHLADHLDQAGGALRELGIGPGDRVAMVLPQGPELATALLAVAVNAGCAPLNPSCRSAEYEFFLSDLQAKALILPVDSGSRARAAARNLGIPIVGMRSLPEAAAGVFTLEGESRGSPRPESRTTLDRPALVLYTSGTTGKPKRVPLSQANLASSASSMATTLHLAASDRCMNVMPLFHIHGIMVWLASLAAGSSAMSCPPFEGAAFFAWMDEFRPTWYSAVPTIHQAVLKHAPSHRDVVARRALRFIRSASAPLPALVSRELERIFEVPVIQAYGMTEAAHQITSNPLPPRARKDGSVGVAAGPEVAVLDGDGHELPWGTTGEVAIRGANVMLAQRQDPRDASLRVEAGWFRTGDLGHMDHEGYLFLEGRLKEIINRGGEKIAPVEIDNVLLEHPAVAQAATFPVPHPTLGEDVSAAVVLRDGTTVTDDDLRLFAAQRLTDPKIPRRIVIVSKIPTGPTGKLERGRLADALGLTTRARGKTKIVGPRSPLERQLIGIWERVLDHRPLGIRDNFFDLGGDSLLAAQMAQTIEQECGLRLSVAALMPTPTIEGLARRMVHDLKMRLLEPISPIQIGGTNIPLFFLHGDVATGGLYSLRLARALGPQQPVYSVHPHGLGGPVPTSMQLIAADHIRAIRTIQPEGPYRLAGVCKGALAAFEMAHQLSAEGERIERLILIDPPEVNTRVPIRALHAIVETLACLTRRDEAERRAHFVSLRERALALEYFVTRVLKIVRSGLSEPAHFISIVSTKLQHRLCPSPAHKTRSARTTDRANLPADDGYPPAEIYAAHRRATAGYIPRRLRGHMTIVLSDDQPLGHWASMADRVIVVPVPGAHQDVINRDIDVIGQRLRSQLSEA